MSNYQVRADVFPATLTLTSSDPDSAPTVYDKVRVILTLDHIYVFQDASPKPKLVFEDRLTTYTPPLPSTRVRKASQLLDRSAKLTTEEGYSASFLKTGGCGCGSRLKTTPVSSLLPTSPISQAASSNDSI